MRRTHSARATGRTTRITTAAFAALIVGAPMLLAGVLPWTVNLIAAAALGCLALALLLPRGSQRGVLPISVAICAAALWTGLQALPLPCGLVAFVAPDSARETRASHALLEPAASTPSCTLSRDPAQTRQELIHGVAISATFLGTLLLCAAVGRRRVLWLIASSVLTMSSVALLHALFRWDDVFGVYTPVEVTRQILLAPIVNQNNLGAFAALGLPLWAGLTYRHAIPRTQWLGYLAMGMCATTAILSLSRGAIAMLVVGCAVMGVAALRHVRERGRADTLRSARAREIALVVGVAAVVWFVTSFAADQIRHDVVDTDLGKLALIQRALGFAWSHFWIGVGRGAFSSTFAAVEGHTTRYAYVESFVVQWATDWGVPVALGLLVIIGKTLLQALRDANSLVRIGALTALLAWSAQNLVDLAFELVGIAVVAAALLAAVVAPSRGSAAGGSPLQRFVSIRRLGMLVVVAGSLSLLTLGPALSGNALAVLEARLRDATQAGDREEFRSVLERALRLHPSEPVFAVLAANEAVMHGDARSEPWLRRATSLAPGWAATPLLSARWHIQSGRLLEAVPEVRRAAEVDPQMARELGCYLAQVDAALALDTAPRGQPARAKYLEQLGRCVGYDHPSSEALDAAILRELPRSTQALQRMATRLDRIQHDPVAALRVLDTIMQIDPHYGSAYGQSTQILIDMGRFKDAVAIAVRGLPLARAHERAGILVWRARAHALLRDDAGLEACLGELRGLAGSDAAALASAYAVEGSAMASTGRTGAALRAYREAYRLDEQPTYLAAIARFAETLGDRPLTLWAYVQMCVTDPTNEAACARRKQLIESQTWAPR